MFLRCLLCLAVFFSHVCFASPRVVVTLKPIHGLVASVMQGVNTPVLLLPDGASPHTFQLKPSTLRHVKEADLIIWVGPSLETFLTKTLRQSGDPARLLTLETLPNIHRLPLRHGREWAHAHDHTHDHGTSAIDPHIWLEIHNAIVIVDATANALAQRDPTHAALYFRNARATNGKLRALQQTLTQQLMPVRDIPFLVYHDGYQYFEHAFHLSARGSIITHSHLPLSAYALRQLRQIIATQKIQCIFRETEFNNPQIQKSLLQLGVRVVELDPLGTRFPPGPEHYFQTLQALGNDLVSGLRQTTPQS